MMRVFGVLAVGVVCLALSACTPKTTDTAGQLIDSSFKVDGARWGSGTTIYVLVKTFDASGTVGVCGAWSARGGSNIPSGLHSQVMAAGRVVLDGITLVQGLTFMARHGGEGDIDSGEGDLRGKAANCVKTEVPWQARFDSARPDVDFPRMKFRI